MESHKKRNIIIATGSTLLTVLIISAAIWVLLHRQYVWDQITVWTFRPDAAVLAIEDRVNFSDRGAFYFYATQPTIAGSDTFNQDCPRQEVSSPILGCYSNGRIYIYDVTNEKLDGIEEVTAAHEMLHGVWERLTTYERDKLTTLLDEAYRNIDDPELKERMDYYARTEPGQLYNELHSIIGTERRSLSGKLEDYYSQFFQDRSVIVGLHEKYSRVFANLTNRAETLYDDMTSLGVTITSASTRYNQSIQQLSIDINSFNQRAQSGGFSSVAQFNRERAALIARSNQLENDRATINANITTYNDKYTEYQAIAEELAMLNQSIDSFSQLQDTPTLQ